VVEGYARAPLRPGSGGRLDLQPLQLGLGPYQSLGDGIDSGAGGRCLELTLRPAQTIEADRHTADDDRVAISNVGDLAGQDAARTGRGVGRRSEYQDSQSEDRDRSQLHLSGRA
jgi:hypothetical protein